MPSPPRSPTPATVQLASSGRPSSLRAASFTGPLLLTTWLLPFIAYWYQRFVPECRSSTSSLPSPSKSATAASRQSRFVVRSVSSAVWTVRPFIRARCHVPATESRVRTSVLPSPSKSPRPITSQSRLRLEGDRARAGQLARPVHGVVVRGAPARARRAVGAGEQDVVLAVAVEVAEAKVACQRRDHRGRTCLTGRGRDLAAAHVRHGHAGDGGGQGRVGQGGGGRQRRGGGEGESGQGLVSSA